MRQIQHQDTTSKLGRLFELCEEKTISLGDDDLMEIIQHQLRTPLLAELRLAPGDLLLLKSIALAPDQQPLNTFGDLLRHSRPPLALLCLVKDFAKQADGPLEDSLPGPVASALYLLSIAAALVRLGNRLTTMDAPDLRQGLTWLIAQSWIELPMRNLATEALTKF